MMVVYRKYCDRCGKMIRDGYGAEVHKCTVNCHSHPVRHLCEKCYAEVFARKIAKEREAEALAKQILKERDDGKCTT